MSLWRKARDKALWPFGVPRKRGVLRVKEPAAL